VGEPGGIAFVAEIGWCRRRDIGRIVSAGDVADGEQ
jgi:hypothetical protein